VSESLKASEDSFNEDYGYVTDSMSSAKVLPIVFGSAMFVFAFMALFVLYMYCKASDHNDQKKEMLQTPELTEE